MNMDLRDKAFVEHLHELEHEAQQRRLLACARGQRHSRVKKAAGHIGKALVSLGIWLEHFEQREEVTSWASVTETLR
ncbi:MAG TPA: hypothetical protein VKR06_02675 [Ktedonosporobacter sp.]|nr:hypothetical protein [Ktedonosporobacter sp.]